MSSANIAILEKQDMDGGVRVLYCDVDTGLKYYALATADTDRAINKAIADHIKLRRDAGLDHAGQVKAAPPSKAIFF